MDGRREQNRLSAQRYRQRQKQKVLQLEKKNQQLLQTQQRLMKIINETLPRLRVQLDQQQKEHDDVAQKQTILKIRNTSFK